MRTWTSALRFLRGLIIAFCVAGTLATPAWAATHSWATLSPMQREALAPLAQQWDGLSEIQKKRLLGTAKRYPGLTPLQKERYQARLTEWSKLTPEQRDRARAKYKALRKAPPEKREELKKMARQRELERSAASAPASAGPAIPPR